MYSYTGKNSHIAKVIDAVNSANAAGEVYKVNLQMGNVLVRLLSPSYQRLAIEALVKTKASEKVYIERWKSPTTRRPFKKAVARGEVLVSNYAKGYLRYVMTVTPKNPKNNVLSDSFPSNWAFSIDDNLYLPVAEQGPGYPIVPAIPTFSKVGLSPDDLYGWPGYWLWKGRVSSWGDNGNGNTDSITLTLPAVLGATEPMPLLDLRGDPDWLECTPAITQCGNKLVQAQADVLTAIAEMRETVEGLQSNVLRTAGWINDMIRHGRSRQESKLLDRVAPLIDLGSKRAYMRRAKRLLRQAQKRELRLRRRIEDKYGNHSAPKAIDRLGAHWLDAQYGIQPAVLTINDLLETLQRVKRVFQRRRVAWAPRFNPLEKEGWEITDHSLSKGWVWGKARNELSTYLGSLASYGRFNIPLTAWERIPLSFVVDWVFPIGDILSSLRIGDLGEPQIFMTKSYNREIDIKMVKETDAATYTVTVSGYVYARLLAQPAEGILQLGLKPNLALSIERWVTAFALSWARVRGTKIQERILK